MMGKEELTCYVSSPEEVVTFVESDELKHRVGQEWLFPVQMLILEATNNALKISDRGSKIRVYGASDQIVISVRDRGPGFSFARSLEQQKRFLSANPLSSSGRGLIIIDSLADRVAYTDEQELLMYLYTD